MAVVVVVLVRESLEEVPMVVEVAEVPVEEVLVGMVVAVAEVPVEEVLVGMVVAVLSCYPMKAAIQFVLLHRTGFTSDLVEMCTSLVGSGMNFYNIESLIVERRWET